MKALSFGLLVMVVQLSFAQKTKDVYVDRDGVMRWGDSKVEVRAFGVNYTAPFAHAYRTAKRNGVDLKKAIDDDVYHFARLGFDLYRVHVWDCEISDSLGNLLDNDHLQLFDYMLMKMKERGIKFMLTPIAYWPNGYPEPEEKTPGFSTKYGKDACLVNEDAIKAQENYLAQFMNHVNPYTKRAYKDDPDIIAFEISNEPHHREAAEKVTTFIKRMVTSIKSTGCKKPIFYNISHSIQLEDAYFAAGISGGTFQWYPTGLGAGHELGGNYLTNVDSYAIPFAENPGFKKIAKLVYEFDAADVGRSYIYPAMARSFRTAGMQIATHFAYDPTFMADVNTEYSTHYMNLVYAPQKALSLKIAGEVFHHVPLYKNYGHYPANATFDNFRVSYEQDLAELVSDQKFFYTNNTTTRPPAVDKLQEIAGAGNSPIVHYNGTGAYFLDKISSGAWRFEVLPDVIWVDDPYKATSPSKKVAVVKWSAAQLSIDLPELGKDFSVRGINEGNMFKAAAENGTVNLSPGTYLLTNSSFSKEIDKHQKLRNIFIDEFAAPKSNVDKLYVRHTPSQELAEGSAYTIEVSAIAPTAIQNVEVFVYGEHWRPDALTMKRVNDYTYQLDLPAKYIKEGYLRYFVVVTDDKSSNTYPSTTKGKPGDFGFIGNPYQVRVLPKGTTLYLFNALSDANDLTRQWLRTSGLKPLADPGKAELQVNVERLFVPDVENTKAEAIFDYSMQYFFGRKIRERRDELRGFSKIIFRGRSLQSNDIQFQLALVMRDGSAYGKVITLSTATEDYEIDLNDLSPVQRVTLPRPYPSFLPYYFISSSTPAFDLSATETLQFSIGPGLSERDQQMKQSVAIESVRLE